MRKKLTGLEKLSLRPKINELYNVSQGKKAFDSSRHIVLAQEIVDTLDGVLDTCPRMPDYYQGRGRGYGNLYTTISQYVISKNRLEDHDRINIEFTPDRIGEETTYDQDSESHHIYIIYDPKTKKVKAIDRSTVKAVSKPILLVTWLTGIARTEWEDFPEQVWPTESDH